MKSEFVLDCSEIVYVQQDGNQIRLIFKGNSTPCTNIYNSEESAGNVFAAIKKAMLTDARPSVIFSIPGN